LQSRGTVSSLVRPFCLCALLLVCAPVFSEPKPRPSRIVCREELAPAKRNQLSGKLREITGWSNLEFDSSGFLQLGTNQPSGGSASARALLRTANAGNNILILEDASDRADIAFSRVIPGRWKNSSLTDHSVYVVLIDFSDFDHLMGDRRALAAFDAGWGLLHEIDHVVNNSIDSEKLGVAGDCEDHINQMRHELNLPERSEYFYTMLPQTEFSEFRTRFVRMPFEWKDPGSNRRRRYWLMWDATAVGGLIESQEIARTKSR
jgi:hypothetical protein